MQKDRMKDTLISTIAISLKEKLSETISNGHKNYYAFELDCSTMAVNYLEKDIRDKDSDYYKLINELQELTGPVLYWFEIKSNTDRQLIRDCIVKHKARSSRITPYLRPKFNADSDCLYVGKVKRNFYGRIIQHMGFYSTPKTQGLQLYHWAKDIGLVVTVHCYELQPEMIDMIAMMEFEMAERKRPIVGKH